MLLYCEGASGTCTTDVRLPWEEALVYWWCTVWVWVQVEGMPVMIG